MRGLGLAFGLRVNLPLTLTLTSPPSSLEAKAGTVTTQRERGSTLTSLETEARTMTTQRERGLTLTSLEADAETMTTQRERCTPPRPRPWGCSPHRDPAAGCVRVGEQLTRTGLVAPQLCRDHHNKGKGVCAGAEWVSSSGSKLVAHIGLTRGLIYRQDSDNRA